MTLPAPPTIATLPFRLKFRQLVLLDALGASQSLRKAAAQTHLTQPAASRAMAELESAFGVQLFERSHSGMAPTVYGNALIQHARRVLFDVQQAHAEIQALRSGSQGVVRLGSLLPPATGLLPKAVGEIKKRLPHLRISLEQLPQKPGHRAVPPHHRPGRCRWTGAVRAFRRGLCAGRRTQPPVRALAQREAGRAH
jgi:molybdenum-dependent DNA-binding transcriptional regulator ModE